MENLASNGYSEKFDNKVKEELLIARIPIITLPSYLNTEVKTRYIGYSNLSNPFKFYRAWTYWVVDGWVSMHTAKEIFKRFPKEWRVRAYGHAGNIDPSSAVYLCESRGDVDYVTIYHIDTLIGLCRFCEYLDKLSIIHLNKGENYI